MTQTEARILQNQIEIMWTLHYLLRSTKPDLVGRGGQLDGMCADLVAASKESDAIIKQQAQGRE